MKAMDLKAGKRQRQCRERKVFFHKKIRIWAIWVSLFLGFTGAVSTISSIWFSFGWLTVLSAFTGVAVAILAYVIYIGPPEPSKEEQEEQAIIDTLQP